jgi:hypothetical protein
LVKCLDAFAFAYYLSCSPRMQPPVVTTQVN